MQKPDCLPTTGFGFAFSAQHGCERVPVLQFAQDPGLPVHDREVTGRQRVEPCYRRRRRQIKVTPEGRLQPVREPR